MLLDVSPRGLLEIGGDRLPASYRRRLQRFRYGGGVCKVDFALSGPVPWTAPGCELAGHAAPGRHPGRDGGDRGGGRGAAGTPERPYVLAAQPGVVDPGRAPAGQHTLWTYAHVPAGSTRDLGDVVTAQVERFAPGFRDLVLARNVVTAAQEEEHNANYVGGDIAGGAPTPWQMVMRPVPRWDPYRTPIDGRLSLLGLDAAGTGRARHGRGARGPARRCGRSSATGATPSTWCAPSA